MNGADKGMGMTWGRAARVQRGAELGLHRGSAETPGNAGRVGDTFAMFVHVLTSNFSHTLF